MKVEFPSCAGSNFTIFDFSLIHGILTAVKQSHHIHQISATGGHMVKGQPTPSFLSDTERAALQKIAQLESGMDSQRANALLLIDRSISYREAGEKSGLTLGQARYALIRYRRIGLAMFPPQPVVEQPKEQKVKSKNKKKPVKKDKKKKKEKKKAEKKKSKKRNPDSKKKKDKKKKTARKKKK